MYMLSLSVNVTRPLIRTQSNSQHLSSQSEAKRIRLALRSFTTAKQSPSAMTRPLARSPSTAEDVIAHSPTKMLCTDTSITFLLTKPYLTLRITSNHSLMEKTHSTTIALETAKEALTWMTIRLLIRLCWKVVIMAARSQSDML
jgi:hypothetical protein